MCATILRYTGTQTALPVFVSTNKSCTQKYNLLLLIWLLLLHASMFVHTAQQVFSIFCHSVKISCGRNNTKMARANYEICTVLRYRRFRSCFEYTTFRSNQTIFWRWPPAAIFGEVWGYISPQISPIVLTPNRTNFARKHVVWAIKRKNRSATVPIETQISMAGNLADVITCAMFQDKIFRG